MYIESHAITFIYSQSLYHHYILLYMYLLFFLYVCPWCVLSFYIHFICFTLIPILCTCIKNVSGDGVSNHLV